MAHKTKMPSARLHAKAVQCRAWHRPGYEALRHLDGSLFDGRERSGQDKDMKHTVRSRPPEPYVHLDRSMGGVLECSDSKRPECESGDGDVELACLF